MWSGHTDTRWHKTARRHLLGVQSAFSQELGLHVHSRFKKNTWGCHLSLPQVKHHRFLSLHLLTAVRVIQPHTHSVQSFFSCILSVGLLWIKTRLCCSSPRVQWCTHAGQRQAQFCMYSWVSHLFVPCGWCKQNRSASCCVCLSVWVGGSFGVCVCVIASCLPLCIIRETTGRADEAVLSSVQPDLTNLTYKYSIEGGGGGCWLFVRGPLPW